MSAKRLICAVVTLLAVWALANTAVAADGLYYAWGGYTPWPYFASIYALENAPYYALHPPVYYSYPVPRPYGYLPYPHLPGPLAQGVYGYRPRVVVSPYVAEPPVSAMATGPEVMFNPYAVAKDPAEPLPEGSLPPRVQVTYPAKMFAQAE